MTIQLKHNAKLTTIPIHRASPSAKTTVALKMIKTKKPCQTNVNNHGRRRYELNPANHHEATSPIHKIATA